MRVQLKWKLTAALMALAVALAGCSPPAQVQSGDLMQGITPQTVQAPDRELLDQGLYGLNDFTWKLLQASAKEDSNLMLSPASVYLALAMALNGAEGETRTAILNALSSAELSPESLSAFSQAYLSEVQADRENYILSIANSLWLRDGFEADPEFLQKNADYFGAAIRSLDFDSPKAPEAINQWVSDATRKTIDQIVDEIDPAVMMYLINAIYFKADWENPFKAASTYPRNFETPSGSKETPFMHGLMTLEVVENDSGKGLLMPYVGGETAMLAVLPGEGISPLDWIQAIDPAAFKALLETGTSKSVDLAFPKFETRYEDNLMNELEALGMGIAFSPGEADFSLMQPSREKTLFISAVQHKTFIRADEKGTEAAAVTSVEVSLTSMPVYDETMIFDRPFIYAIIDMNTGTPLFIGVMSDPTV